MKKIVFLLILCMVSTVAFANTLSVTYDAADEERVIAALADKYRCTGEADEKACIEAVLAAKANFYVQEYEAKAAANDAYDTAKATAASEVEVTS